MLTVVKVFLFDVWHLDTVIRVFAFVSLGDDYFANGVLAAKPLVDKDVLDNKAIYPDEETMKRLFTVTTYDQAVQKVVTREWTRVKTGK